MLQPQDRRLLLEALRPPAGTQLDFAIATTFSLDLVALLITPLAFTFFDWESEDGAPITEPVALLQAIRRNADRLAVFCQVGEIKVPPREQRLFAYLEDCVHQVTAPRLGGVFHPKIWVLRYVGSDAGTIYRVICASRNITFDRSWDTLLVLEGVLRERLNAYKVNHPLGDFIEQLPHLALEPVTEELAGRISQIQQEIRRVEFAPPDGLEVTGFWPLGIHGHQRSPFVDVRDRLLVISPFLSPGTLEDLTPTLGKGVLVSRHDSLNNLSAEVLARFEQVLVFDSAVDEADAEPEAERVNDAPSPEREDADDVLRGLHAKLFVADDGWHARVWTGSANATEPAFSANVEFLVELRGKKSETGIDAVLGLDGAPSDLRKLLQPYSPTERSADEAWQQRFDREALRVRLAMARAGFRAEAAATLDRDVFSMTLRCARPEELRDQTVTINCWPITCSEELFAQATETERSVPAAVFPQLSIEALTPFFAFCARIAVEGRVGECRFVLKLPLTGAPADRREHLLRFVIRNQREFIAYLLMLLAGPDAGPIDATGLQKLAGGSAGWLQAWGNAPVFETLVRCLDRNPTQLDEVARLLADLGGTEAGQALIPKGFPAIWAPIWAARQSLQARDESQPR